MKPLKKKLTKNEMRVKKHTKAIRETLKKAKIKVCNNCLASMSREEIIKNNGIEVNK